MRLKGRNVVVVGAGPGLGSAVIYLALKEGASIYAFVRNAEVLERVRELSAYGPLHVGIHDFSRLEEAAKAAEEVKRHFSTVHGLVVTAGGWIGGGVEELDERSLEDMLSRNLKAHLYAVKAFLPLLAERSSVVLTSAVGGAYPLWLGNLAYTSSKAALAMAAQALAAELLGRNIRVNAVAPGGMTRDFSPGGASPPRLGAAQAPPEEVAKVIVWLLTDEASWVTGAVIPVDGGRRLLGAL